MTQETIESLLNTLLHSSNGAWQDDAAQELANCSDQARAEEALFFAISSPKLDESLRRTCAESLVTIWIRLGEVTFEKIQMLHDAARDEAELLLHYAVQRNEIKILNGSF